VRGLPAGFQCGAQGVLRDTGREVLGAARGRESENERKFEKRPSDASASAGCTRALPGLKLVACLGLGVLWPQMAPSVPKQACGVVLAVILAKFDENSSGRPKSETVTVFIGSGTTSWCCGGKVGFEKAHRHVWYAVWSVGTLKLWS
jgi:hypothetical protein